MNIMFSLNDEQQEARRQQIKALQNHPEVIRFLKKNQLDLSFLEKNASYFQRWIEGIEKCQGCRGLSFCRHSLKGRVVNLYIDETGFLEERYQPCRYEKQHQKQICHRSMYRLSHMSNDEYRIDLSQIDLKRETKQYIDTYTQVIDSLTSSKSVYLYGQPGVGKSYLMSGVANYYAKQNQKVSYVKVPQLIQDLKQSMFDGEYRQDILGHLRFSDVLILDDIGSESITAWTRDEILFPVLDYRMNHGKKTYFTSNYTIDELQEQYCTKENNSRVAALRLMERIRAVSGFASLLGKSRR